MKSTLISSVAGLALVAGGLAGFGTGSASAGTTIDVVIPENCTVTPQDVPKGADPVFDIDCELPPECEYVTVDLGGILQATSIECDLEPGCELESGTFFGQTYWYVDCEEAECIGGCDSVVPWGIGFTTRQVPSVAIGR